jgi:HAD superfamily hydrolase (TIGR01490 family)
MTMQQTPKNLCLFDLDHTLLPIDSDHAWGQFMVQLGWVEPQAFGRANDQFYADYQAGTLDIHAYVAFTTQAWRHRAPAEQDAAHAQFMCEVITPALRPQARALVAQHRAQGDLVALVTATNEFVTAPIAKAFGIEHLIAVRLARDSAGCYTGQIAGIPSFQRGKVARTTEWLESLGLHLAGFERVFVYSDSINDLALLEMATDPVATNPAPSLEKIARAKSWRVLQLFSQ